MTTNGTYAGQVTWRGVAYGLEFARYENGRTAIALRALDDPADVERATVNVSEVPLELDQILIKDIDENEGMVAALVGAGVVADMGRDIPVNRYHLRLCRLLRPAVVVPGAQVQWDGRGYEVVVERLLDGWPALVLRNPANSGDLVRATFHVPCVPLRPGQVLVRYLRLLAALTGAGVVADTGKSTEVNRVTLHVVSLTAPVCRAAAVAGCDITV
jgi:hypothetical protein